MLNKLLFLILITICCNCFLNTNTKTDDQVIIDEESTNCRLSSVGGRDDGSGYFIDDYYLYYQENPINLSFKPKYTKYNLITNLQPGDIIYENAGGFGITHHIALVESIQYDDNRKMNWVRIIEATDKGVFYGILDDYRYDTKTDTIYRHSNMTAEKASALLDFARKQLFKSYSIGIADDSVSAEKWYCSELAWAAYKSVGITLCSENPGIITPADIRDLNLPTVSTGTHEHVFDYLSKDSSVHNKHCINCGTVIEESHNMISGLRSDHCSLCEYTEFHSTGGGIGRYNLYDTTVY